MADQTQKQTLTKVQEDVALLRTDMAVAKNDIGQMKANTSEIKESMSAIMDGYVPTTLYLRDQQAIYREIEIAKQAADTAQTSADSANELLAKSKPGLDLSNKIVQQLMALFAGGIVTVVVLYLAFQNGGAK